MQVKTLCNTGIDTRFPPECRVEALASRVCPSCGGRGEMHWQLCYKAGMEGSIVIFVSGSSHIVCDTDPTISSVPTRSPSTVPR